MSDGVSSFFKRLWGGVDDTLESIFGHKQDEEENPLAPLQPINRGIKVVPYDARTHGEITKKYGDMASKATYTASQALYDRFSELTNLATWAGEQVNPYFWAHPEQKGQMDPVTHWLRKQSAAMEAGKQTFDPNSLEYKMIYKSAKAIPDILLLQGMGAAVKPFAEAGKFLGETTTASKLLSKSPLPFLGALEGAKSGGWMGALTGGAQGAALGEMLHGVGNMPSILRPPLGAVVFGGPTAINVAMHGGDVTDVLTDSVIGMGLSLGGEKITMRDYFAKPLKPFTPSEIETVKYIQDRLGGIRQKTELTQALGLAEDPIPTVIRRYGVESPEFDVSVKKAVPEIMKLHKDGGSTWNLKRGNLAGKDLYAVSVFPEKGISMQIPGKELPQSQLEGWLKFNRDIFKDPRVHVGTWYDSKTDMTWLDAVITIKDRNAAIYAGTKANQKAITYLKNFEEIPTGGTGQDPGTLGSIYDRVNFMTRPVDKKQNLIRLFHLSRGLSGDSEVIDPHAMGRGGGQTGEERRQINLDGTFKPGFLPKSAWYTEETPNMEGHRWYGANVYEHRLDKDSFLIIPKDGQVKGNPDTLAMEANKIGWYDENTGQARVISPVVADRLGTFMANKRTGKVSGRELWDYIQHDVPGLTTFANKALMLKGTDAVSLPKIVGLKEFGNEQYFRGIQFMFKRYPKLSSLVREIKFTDEISPEHPGLSYYDPITQSIVIAVKALQDSAERGGHKFNPAFTIAHEIIHSLEQRLPREEFLRRLALHAIGDAIGDNYFNLPLEKETNKGAGTAFKRFVKTESTIPMTGDIKGWPGVRTYDFAMEEIDALIEKLKHYGKLGIASSRTTLPAAPDSFRKELEDKQATGGLDKQEERLLRDIQSGRLHEDEAKIRALIGNPKVRKLLKEKGREVLMSLGEKMIDRWSPARKAVQQYEELSNKSIDFEKNIYNLLRLFPGRFGSHYLAFKDLQAILRPVRKWREELESYGVAERVKERAQRDIDNPEWITGKATTREEGIRAQQAIAAKIGANPYKKVMQAHQKFTEWSDKWILQTLRDASLISPKLYHEIKSKNKAWFPFEAMKYVDEANWDAMPAGSEFFSVRGQDIVRPMTGGKGQIVPPFESVLSTLNKTITLAAKNKILVQLVKYRSLSPEMKKLIVPIKMSDKIGDANNFEDLKVVLNGKVTRWLVPKDLGDTLKRMDMKTADTFMKLVKSTSALFRAGTTSYYLPFTIGNIPRDIKMAILCNNYGFNAVNWATGLWHGLRSSFGFPSDLFKQYMASGGSFSGLIMKKPSTTVNKLFEPRGVEFAKEAGLFIKNLAAAAELAPRLGVFQRAMGEGFGSHKRFAGSLQEAGFESRNATIDFSKAGTLMKLANQYIPFINARMQAKVNLVTRAMDPETSIRTISKAVAWAVIPSLSAYFYNILHYPDEYSEIPGYVKDNYDVVVLGSKKDDKGRYVPDYLKLTKGDVEQMFVNPLISFLNFAQKKDPKKIHEVAIDWFSEMSPIPFAREGHLSLSRALAGGIPPLFRAPIEYVQGKSLYTERETVPYDLQRMSPEEQYTERTPTAYKLMGKALKQSPLKLQSLAKNLGGSVFYTSDLGGAIAGRVRSTTGGESMNVAYKLQKKAEEGYFTTRRKIENAYQDRRPWEATQLQREWNVDFVDILRKMQNLTGQSLAQLFQTPFYKMYSFQNKDLEAVRRGTQPEKEKESWLSGLEKKLNYKFYND